VYSRVDYRVPQGSILGPILFLLYTADVLIIAARHDVSADSYADDTQLYVHTTTDNCLAVFGRLTSCINEIAVWISSNRLKLNTGKTQSTCLGTLYQLAKVDASVLAVNGVAVDLLRSVSCLGVSIDQELTFADHTRSLACRCFFWIRLLRLVRRTLTFDTTIALVNALIISRLDYCNSVLVGAYDIQLRQLQGVLNAAVRLIARRCKFDGISSTIRDVLHWLPIRQRVNFKLSVLVFNCLRNLVPSYLMNMCQPVTRNLHRRRLRSAVPVNLIVPPMRTVHYGPRSFAVAAP